MLLSPFIPLSPPSCPMFTSLFSLSASPLLSCKRFISTTFLDSLYIRMLVYIGFSLSDLLHSMIGSRFMYSLELIQMHSFFMAEWYSIIYMYHSFFIHSSVNDLDIVNSVAMNTGVHVSFSIMVFSGYMPSSRVVGSYDSFILSFFKSILSSIVDTLIYSPTNSARGTLFYTPSPVVIVCRFFDDGHSDRCEVISHCSFDLNFPINEWCWASFHVFSSYLYVFFGEMSV